VNSHSALPDAIMCAKVFQSFFIDPNEEEYKNGMQCVFEQEQQEWNDLRS
jgi:hypothetical protein